MASFLHAFCTRATLAFWLRPWNIFPICARIVVAAHPAQVGVSTFGRLLIVIVTLINSSAPLLYILCSIADQSNDSLIFSSQTI